LGDGDLRQRSQPGATREAQPTKSLTVRAGPGPDGVDVDATTGDVYVVNGNSNTISIFT
jgi:DNA-binding beta-propeller fold protein YncE